MTAQAKQQATVLSAAGSLVSPNVTYLLHHLYNLGSATLCHKCGESLTSGLCLEDEGLVLGEGLCHSKGISNYK